MSFWVCTCSHEGESFTFDILIWNGLVFLTHQLNTNHFFLTLTQMTEYKTVAPLSIL